MKHGLVRLVEGAATRKHALPQPELPWPHAQAALSAEQEEAAADARRRHLFGAARAAIVLQTDCRHKPFGRNVENSSRVRCDRFADIVQTWRYGRFDFRVGQMTTSVPHSGTRLGPM